MDLGTLFNIPPWAIGAIYGVLTALVCWQLFGQRALFRSRLTRQIEHIASDGEIADTAISPLRKQLLAAGLNWTEQRFYLTMGGLALGVLVVGSAFNLPPILLIVAAGAAAYAPRWYIGSKVADQAEKMEKELPMALTRISSLLRMQPDIGQVLANVAEGLSVGGETPLAREFRQTAAEMRTVGTEAALVNMAHRSPSTSLDNLAISLRIYARAGGNFAATMAESAQRAAGIMDGRNKAGAKAGEATAAAKALPLVLVGVSLFALQDPEFGGFYRTEMGQIIALGVVFAMFYGYQFIKSMVREVV